MSKNYTSEFYTEYESVLIDIGQIQNNIHAHNGNCSSLEKELLNLHIAIAKLNKQKTQTGKSEAFKECQIILAKTYITANNSLVKCYEEMITTLLKAFHPETINIVLGSGRNLYEEKLVEFEALQTQRMLDLNNNKVVDIKQLCEGYEQACIRNYLGILHKKESELIRQNVLIRRKILMNMTLQVVGIITAICTVITLAYQRKTDAREEKKFQIEHTQKTRNKKAM
ncbi:MAG: hypothetical protein J0L80_15850 [Chitinophagales bacterium]|nr:hypothetical protein [Chitinophagales bacterium]